MFQILSWVCRIGKRMDSDAAARCEFTAYFDVFRIHQFNQVIHNDIDSLHENHHGYESWTDKAWVICFLPF